MYKKIVYVFFCMCVISFILSCNKEENAISKNIIWKNKINGKSLIFDDGIGYPIYNNTVVFHSTPQPWGTIRESILHGLDTDTGQEKWRLTNADFAPKKSLELDNVDYYYQKDNIIVCADFQYKDNLKETFIYALDIEKGIVLWVKEFTKKGVQFGRMVKGRGNYAYVDFMKDDTVFSLIKINIATGNFSEVFNFTQSNIPEGNPEKQVNFDQMSEIYTDNSGNEYVALSISGYNYATNRFKAYMTLCVYNLTQNKIAYSSYINNQTLAVDEWDEFYGRVTFHNGKLIIGKGRHFYCVDAYQDKGILWKYKTGSYGTDNAMQVFGYQDMALGYTLDRLFAFDINTGKKLYETSTGSSTSASVIDGILYQRDGSDFLMRDPRTGKELKRIVTGINEQAFSSSRPNGKDGKIFIHSYTDAYCIKAWGR